MDYSKFLILCICISIVSISCSLLDSEQESDESDEVEEVMEPSGYASETDAEADFDEIYSEISHSVVSAMLISSISSDIVEFLPSGGSSELEFFEPFDKYQVQPASPVLESFWNRSYSAIQKADTVLIRLQESDLDQSFIDSKIGEALFLRAMVYFDLARIFGGVPVFDPVNDPRISRFELYNFIINDLETAAALLPLFSEASTPSQQAAEALMIRGFLYMNEWYPAENIAYDILDSGLFSLSADYVDVFQNPGSSGSIFSLELEDDNLDQWYLPGDQGGLQNLALHQQFVDTAQSRPADERNGMIGSYESNGETVYYTTKFAPSNGRVHIPILRYSEVLLILAEATARAGYIPEALDALNFVRERSDVGTFQTNSVDELLSMIEHERSIEFFGEGHRWFDLVRTEQALGQLQDIPLYFTDDNASMIADYQNLYPIPQAAIDKNPDLTQNPGY